MKRGKKSTKKIAVPKNKKTLKKKVSKKKKLTNKQWLTISIVAFLIFAIALAFVNVPQNASMTGAIVPGIGGEGDISARIGTFLTDFIDFDTIDPIIFKYVFFGLLIIFIFSVLSIAKFPESRTLRFLLALPVSYIAIVLIKPAELFSATIFYSALGMTFIVMIPLIIMVLFTSQVLQGKVTAGRIIIQLMTWYFYLGFLIYFLIRAFTDTQHEYSIGVIAVIIIAMVITFIIIIKNKDVREWIRNKGREARAESLKDVEDIRRAQSAAEAQRAAEALKSSKEIYKGEK